MAYRIESGRLDRATRTPGGGYRIPAAIGRTGVLVYHKADGSEWREYRPPEEAFAAASLESLRAATVTDLHPAGAVTPDNYRALVRGHVGDETRKDEDGTHILAPIYVQDAELIRAIEAREREEVSAGYHTDLDLTPGTSPSGEPYDAIQRNIRYNHVAVGPKGWGRAGPTVALRLDGNLDSVTDPASDAGDREERKPMKTERIDGVDYEIGTDAWRQAREKHEAATKARLADLETEAKTQRARADAAEASLAEAKGRADALETEAKRAADPAVVDALVKARVELIEQARMLKPDVKTDGMSDRQIRADALGIELTQNLDDGYLRGQFDAVVKLRKDAGASLSATRFVADLGGGGGGSALSPAEEARRRHVARNRDGWKADRTEV